MITLSDLINELIFSSNDNSIQWLKIYNAQSFLVNNMWKCAENLCMKMYNSLSLIFENSENIIGRGVEMILKMSIYMFIAPFWNIIKFCKWIMNNCQDWVKGFHEMVLWTGMCKAVVFQNRAACNRLHPLCKSIARGFNS